MSTAANELEAHMAHYDPTDESEHDEGFCIKDASMADWALRKMQKAREKLREKEAVVVPEIEALEDYLGKVRQEYKDTAEFFERHLIAYHQGVYEADPGEKTVRLPHGTLKARKTPDKVEVLDSAVNTLPDAFKRIMVAPDKKALLKHVKETGEVFEGVSFLEGGIKFSVEAGGE